MVNTCCVSGCFMRSSSIPKPKFFRIPSLIANKGDNLRELSERRRRAWFARINRKTVTETTVKSWTRVCSRHFLTGKPAELYDEKNPDWAPTLHMGYACKVANVARFQRSQSREEKLQLGKGSTEMESTEDVPVQHADVSDNTSLAEHNANVTDLQASVERLTLDLQRLEREKSALEAEVSRLQKDNAGLLSEVQCLRNENITLKTNLDDQNFKEEAFQKDDDRVKYYTGLPNYLMLLALLNFISPHISSGPRSVNTKFQELLIVLMRLRLALPVRLLADVFRVGPSTISRIFYKWVDVMYVRLSPLITWPDRESLYRTMPLEFVRSFGRKVTVIIDCFELFIETPSGLKPRSQTFSSYKHHNTIKYLIGITPQGVVSFITNGWGGRCSDKHVTENSDFLDKLLPGDLVLADRGFNIHESVGLMCAEVKIPAFTKGKKQLSAYDVESTRKIAHVRIHVERVIGNVIQKYTILDSTIPVTFLNVAEGDTVTTLDKVVTICCALVNMCPSVVPFD